MFGVELPDNDHAAALEVLAQITEWHTPPGRLYQTAEATGIDHPLLKGCARAFFIKIQPGASVHRHRDPFSVAVLHYTDHIVVATNDKASNWWMDSDGVERSQHLELGKRYSINDRGLLHWATNDGETDRIHLLIEYPIPS